MDVVRGQSRDLRAQPARRVPVGGGPAEELGRHLGQALPVEVGPRVEVGHPGLVDPSLELALEGPPAPREPPDEVLPREEHGLVVGEEMTVVPQDLQVETLELAVRRVDVDDVDLPLDERLVGQRVLHRAHVGRARDRSGA